MTEFFVLFEEWDGAAATAARASARLCRQLDGYCAGTGPAPPAEAVAEARRLTDEANRRLAALRSHLLRQRERVALI